MTIVCVDDHPIMPKALAQNIQNIFSEAMKHAFGYVDKYISRSGIYSKRSKFMKKRLLTKIVTVLLVVATLLTALPMSVFAETAGEATKEEVYIKSIKLARAKKQEEAKQILEKEGYIFVNKNLNEGTGADGVWLGYTTTTDPTKAIYDIKLMNTDGGYTLTSMESVLESQKQSFNNMAHDLNDLVNAFVAAYNEGNIPAQNAYMGLNFFRMVDKETTLTEENGLGYQFVKGNISIEELTEMLLFCDSSIFDSVVKLLTTGIQLTSDNWMQRLSDEGKYDSEKEYSDDGAALNRRASQLLTVLQLYSKTYNTMAKMGLVSGKFDKNGNIVKEDNNTSGNAGTGTEGQTEAVSAQDADIAKIDIERVKSYKLVFDELEKYKYGNGTLKDFFCSLENQKNEEVLYPLVSVLTKEEYAALSFGCFIELALGATAKASDFNDYKKAYDELTKEVKSVYLYAGVNAKLLNEDTVVAFTDGATRRMALTGEYQFYEKESWGEDVWETGRMVATGIAATGAACMCVSKLTLGIMALTGALATATAEGAAGFLAGAVKVLSFVGGGYTQLITYAIAATVAMITYLIYAIDKEINGTIDWDANPIPEYIYDISEISFSQSSANDGIQTEFITRPVYMFYEAVLDTNKKTVDLNAHSTDSTQWIAMYVSYDHPSTGSKPIKAEDFTVTYGNGQTPEGFTPVCRFGEGIAYDLNQWDEDDDVNGIFIFYKQDRNVSVASDRNYYIYDVYLQEGKSPTHCLRLLEAAKYTPLNVNLSPDRKDGVDPVYTYLGYKVTNVKEEAITDIRIDYGVNQGQVKLGGATYAASGTSAGVTLYVTKYENAGTPLLASGLKCVNYRSEAPAGYEPVNFFAGGPAASFNLTPDGITPGMKDYFIYFLPNTTFTSGETYLGGISYYYVSDYTLEQCYSKDRNSSQLVPYMKAATGLDYPVSTDENIRNLVSDYGFVRSGYHMSTSNERSRSDSILYYQTHNPYRAIYSIKASTVMDMGNEIEYESVGYTAWNTTWWSGGAYADSAQSSRWLFSFVHNGYAYPGRLDLNTMVYVAGNPSANNKYNSANNAMDTIQPLKLTDVVCLLNGDDASAVSGEKSAYTAVGDIFRDKKEALPINRKGSKNEFKLYTAESVKEKPYVSAITAIDSLSIYRAAGGEEKGISRDDITDGMLLAQLARQGATNFSDVRINTYADPSVWTVISGGGLTNNMNKLKFGYTRTATSEYALRDVFIYFNGFTNDEPPLEIMRGSASYTMLCEIPYNLTGYEESPSPRLYLYGTTSSKAGNKIVDIAFSNSPFMDGYETVRTMNGRSMWAELYEYAEYQKNNHFMITGTYLFEVLCDFFSLSATYDDKSGDALRAQKFFYIHIKRDGKELSAQKPYISEMYVAYQDRGYLKNEDFQRLALFDHLFDQGADSFLNYDLNSNMYMSDYESAEIIYLGYKHTANPNDAVTSIRADHNSGLWFDTKKVNGIEYKRIGGVNMNQGFATSGKADTIYLYYTKSPDAGKPITEIQVQTVDPPTHTVTETAQITPVTRFNNNAPSNLNGGYRDNDPKCAIYLKLISPLEAKKGSYKAPSYGENDPVSRFAPEGSENGKYIAAVYVMDKNTIRQEKLAKGVPSDQCTCAKITDAEVFERLRSMGATTIVETPMTITGRQYGNNHQNKVFIGYSRTDDIDMAVKNMVLKVDLFSTPNPMESFEYKQKTHTLVAEPATMVDKLPSGINLIGSENGQGIVAPSFYLYTTTKGNFEPIYDITVSSSPVKNGWETVISKNDKDPYLEIYEMATKQAELADKDDSDSYDNEIIYTDQIRDWTQVISNTFHPMMDYVTRSYIHCKKYEGDSIEEAKPYISDIYIADGACANEALAKLAAYKPDGLVERDFNYGTGGRRVYMAYKRTSERSKAITDLAVFVGKNPTESRRINVGSANDVRYDLVANVDLNCLAGGEWLYLYATKDAKVSEPIRSMHIETETASGTNDGMVISTVKFADVNGFTDDDPDLNDGAGGEYLYLIIEKHDGSSNITASLFSCSGSMISLLFLTAVGAAVVVFAAVRAKSKKKNAVAEE